MAGPGPGFQHCPSRLQDRIDGITIQARQFQDAGHFDAENIKKKQEALVARYEALKEPMVARMYGCESWTTKKAESRRIDVFKLWC